MSTHKRRIDVMVSSTTNDLGEHRRRVANVITKLLYTPRIMDLDSTTGKDGLSYSFELVDEAEIYILLLGFRYGYIPDDPRNPDQRSMTHLEYRRAKARAERGELYVLPFLLAEARRPESVLPGLDAFRAEVLNDQIRFFENIEDLELSVLQALKSEPVETFLNELVETPDKSFHPKEGEILDQRYTFVTRLGAGGNGEVWQVKERLPDDHSTRAAAIKLLKREISEDEQRVQRFKNEISIAYRLMHPHVIRTTHWGEIGGQFYAVMDYIDGETLREFIAGRHFTDEATARYLGQVAEALYAAHKQGIIHRDVKPENILVKDDRLYLGDFGLAVSPDENESLTETGELVGTKKYMAPEQWTNQPTTPATDLYALGIIAYEMLTGVYPYDASSHGQLAVQHQQAALPTHDRLPEALLRVLHKATAKQPTDRYTSATELITELAHWRENAHVRETIISKYLSNLWVRLKGDAIEKIFVDMQGDVRNVIAKVQEQENVEAEDDEFELLLSGFMVELAADHHQPQQAESQPVDNIIEQLLKSERVVLVGEPGSGKSFTLRRLVMRYIREYKIHQRVPVFVSLNAFKGETDFVTYIQAQMGDLGPYYKSLLDDDGLVLICDALNEMPRQGVDGRQLLTEVRATLKDVPSFVVSCRVRDYNNDLSGMKLERLEVRDLELPAIREFVRRYKILLKYDDDDLWRKIGGSDDLLTFWQEVREKGEPERFWQEEAGIPSYTTASVDPAWRRMWQGAKLIPLARNPYMALVICGLHGRDQIPSNRTELYEAFVADLYEREQKHAALRGQSFPELETLEVFLTGLANQMQAGQTTVLEVATITDKTLLRAGLEAKILTQDGDDLRFSHQLLQEYFAARTLLEKMMGDADPKPVFGETWWNVSVWRETANMLIDFSKEPLRVMRWIAPASLPLVEEIARASDTAISELGKDFLLGVADQQRHAENPIGRAAAYRVLGHPDINADDRPGIGVKGGLPDIDWVMIPAGEFKLGDENESDNPPHKLTLPAFGISRYPVTYMQFHAFIEDSEGFDDPRWWEGLAYPNGHNDTPGDQWSKYWNHPREQVSWYDAMAFCRWLSWRLGGDYDLDKIDEWAVRLPTGFEWERAARGTDGLQYPYGDEFDAHKGNTGVTGIGQTSAVGIFPDGAAPEGVLDMSGNVWEWCLTEYSNPQLKASNADIRPSTRRMLRGGSWSNFSNFTRAAFCLSYDPDLRDDRFGFRLCRRPPSS